eukprot:6133921-Prymnesium_polylepis.1
MGGMAAYQLSALPNTTAVDDAIAAEVAKFESIKLAAAAAKDAKYVSSGIFDPIKFWNDYEKVCHPLPCLARSPAASPAASLA